MPRKVPPVRWFKVTIMRDGKTDMAYDIKALRSEEAKNEAWRRYLLANSNVNRFDKGLATRVEVSRT